MLNYQTHLIFALFLNDQDYVNHVNKGAAYQISDTRLKSINI